MKYLPGLIPLDDRGLREFLSRELQRISSAVNALDEYNQADLAENVLHYGADPTNTIDSSAAIQAALDVGVAVHIPKGTYKLNSSLVLSGYGRLIYGDGPELSILAPTGAFSAITNGNPSIARFIMRDFGITGGNTTLDGINMDGALVFATVLENLKIVAGGRSIYMPTEFNTQLLNCQGSSHNDNVFELQGGNATYLRGCYAHEAPAGKYGYRIYGAAELDSCTGIDAPFSGGLGNGGDWGLFGSEVAKGDAADSVFEITMINCDVEDFKDYGLTFRYQGFAKIVRCDFVAKASGTYQAEIHVEHTSKLLTIDNCELIPKGATRAKLAPIYADTYSNILVNGTGWGTQYDLAGTLRTMASCAVSNPTGTESALKVTSLDVSQFYNRYAGTVTLSGGTANVTFAVAQIDANYLIPSLGTNANETMRWSAKGTGGFTITSSNAASTATVDWEVVRPGT